MISGYRRGTECFVMTIPDACFSQNHDNSRKSKKARGSLFISIYDAVAPTTSFRFMLTTTQKPCIIR
jgi:hypothetical protein